MVSECMRVPYPDLSREDKNLFLNMLKKGITKINVMWEIPITEQSYWDIKNGGNRNVERKSRKSKYTSRVNYPRGL